MFKKEQGQLKSKREYALAILKVWEEELEIKNVINEEIVKFKEKNDSTKSITLNVKTEQSEVDN